MSGISGIGSSGSSSALPNGGLSSVGASLLSSGQAPNPTVAAASASSTTSNSLSSYQKEYQNLQQYDDQELLYASFLSPEEGLANFDSVMQQAAELLGTPEDPGPALSTATASTSTSGTSSTSTSSSALANLPSVASILAASDDEAQQTLNSYSKAPTGSSILDYQA